MLTIKAMALSDLLAVFEAARPEGAPIEHMGPQSA